MKLSLACAGAFTLIILNSGLIASSVPFTTESYNFQLPGGGGGASASLSNQQVEIFCDDFNNEIHVPSSNLANVTVLSTTANLDNTRFGQVLPTDWMTITTGGTQAQNDFFNSGLGDSALARYAMVAYLVSQYNRPAGATTANEEIQMAIWTLMDPSGETISISGYPNPGSDLLAAESWYSGIHSDTTTFNAFLMKFEVVSDAQYMSAANRQGLRTGGFQEQIVETPEPQAIWALAGLFGLVLIARRRRSSVHPRVGRAA